MGQLIWSVTIPFRHLRCSRLFCIVGHLESNVCLGEGRVQWSFTVLAPYIEKVCGIIVFCKFSCGAYVIVVLNSNIVVFLNMRNLFLIGSAIFSMVLSNSSIFLYGVPYTPSRSLILFFAHAYTSATRPALIVWYCAQLRFYKYVMRFNPSTETISKAFILTDTEILWCSHSTFTLYHLLL